MNKVNVKPGCCGFPVWFCCGIWFCSKGHSDCSAFVPQTVVIFAWYVRIWRAREHVCVKGACLNHKVRHNAMENQAVIEARFYVSEEVFHSYRGVGVKKLNCNIAEVGLQLNNR